LERSIISIAASSKTEQLEKNVENAYSSSRKLMMETENLERDLAIEQSTLKLLEDTRLTQEQIQQNLQERIKKELDAAKSQEDVLEKARAEDGKVTNTTHHVPYYGWRSWYYGGGYTYTTSSQKDTTVEQNTASKNINAIEERANELKKRLENNVRNHHITRETTQAKINSLTTQILAMKDRRDKALEHAKQLEAILTRARLEASGCNPEISQKLSEAFKLTLPLFVQLADNTAQVSVTFSVAKSIIQSTAKMPVTSAISIFDSITKLAIAGDYVLNSGFTIAQDPTFAQLQNTCTEVFNSAALALPMLSPAEKTYENIRTFKELSPAAMDDVEKVSAVAAVKPIAAVKPEDIF